MTREDVEKIIMEAQKNNTIANFSKTDLGEINFNCVDFCGTDLTGADLTGADLSRANLRGSDLHGVKLHKANLTRADLTGANLRWANLRGADFTGAKLNGADLLGANLYGADFTGANIDFSVWPLWCGSLGVKIDKRIAAQLAYHFCAVLCDDPEVIAAQNALLPLANQFHLIGGEVKELKVKIKKEKPE